MFPLFRVIFEHVILILLLFANDMAIQGKSPLELQNHLDLLHSYCFTWWFKVTSNKIKVVFFFVSAGLLQNEKWTYDGQILEVVINFKYLGTVSINLLISLNQEHLVGKALKALFLIFRVTLNQNTLKKYSSNAVNA
jgi:hypothetical protein